ncbi:AI-2E family transporter [Romboutsia sp. 13368]|uniref:AI-2E family transporter n=1 Tax=Romboutsia sp. 13368 TaxID=2708053 RepID=UPI0025D0D3E9|nr:AI-2E family transporter [Romboutsia sp. 13368]
MKIDWNRKYTTIAVYAFLVICGSIAFFNVIDEVNVYTAKLGSLVSTLQPFIIGFVIAYLLNFILVFYEEKVLVFDGLKNLKPKAKRGLGLLLTYITAFFILYLFIQFVLPQLVDSIVGLVNDVPTYLTNATKLLEDMTKNVDVNNEYVGMAMDKLNEIITYIINIISNLLPVFGNALKTVASSVWNIVIGLIISIYLLIDKEKFCALIKKIIFAVFNEKHAEIAIELAHRSNVTFGKFLSGKIIDSAIIGVLTFVVLTIFKMPYTLLISVIIGITNIIPFFGPFIGAIPAFVIIMFVSPVKALWFLLIIFIIQQLDGNVIGPKILGDSIGISAFWIVFSLLVASKILGLVGMIIGVPLFAIIYSVIKDIVEAKLRKKGLPTETSDYMQDKK